MSKPLLREASILVSSFSRRMLTGLWSLVHFFNLSFLHVHLYSLLYSCSYATRICSTSKRKIELMSHCISILEVHPFQACCILGLASELNWHSLPPSHWHGVCMMKLWKKDNMHFCQERERKGEGKEKTTWPHVLYSSRANMSKTQNDVRQHHRMELVL